ncbi:N-acetyltransferase [Helicobacter sp. 13S00477-4]|uniref:GNAT family N-acetyltransferase n=1 Tax=Helicobacter sp. 13S00477-4 TaxID=1905759 RepID=UPI000BA54676|nr:N-acetyltransferase [Helicobacter sp. 13S00477-4]PAF51535.1 hypothetical protein BKH44_05695 [Helicobacter sp. 13S00477-4]
MKLKTSLKEDIQVIYEIENSLFSVQDGRFSKKVFFYHLAKKDRLFSLWDEDKIVGYLLVLGYQKSLRVYSLAILSGYQGKGYGEYLCECAINMAREKKKDFIYLEVKSSNQKAINLYQKLGFVVCRILPHYYGSIDGLRMVKFF